jgi:hypothetical protein
MTPRKSICTLAASRVCSPRRGSERADLGANDRFGSIADVERWLLDQGKSGHWFRLSPWAEWPETTSNLARRIGYNGLGDVL